MSIYDLYVEFIETNDVEKKGKCPFLSHQDDTPSFHANIKTDQWYCFGCNDGAGDGGGPVKFIQRLMDVNKKIAQHAVDFYKANKRLPFPSDEAITSYHDALLDEPAVLEYLRLIGVTDEIIEEFCLGWEKTRLIIPVKSRTGFIVNCRKYMPPGEYRQNTDAKTVNIKQLGQNRFYPYSAFDQQEIVIVEGDKDVLVARSQGLNAVTTTGGKQIPASELYLFKGKDVILCLDNDKVGKMLVKTYAKSLKPIVQSLKVVRFDDAKDISEHYEKVGNVDLDDHFISINEFEERNTVNCDLKESIDVENMDTVVNLPAMRITGKHATSYTVPKEIKVDCTNAECKKECPYKGQEIILPVDERDVLNFIKKADTAQDMYVAKKMGCKKAKYEKTKNTNVQIITFQQDITSITAEEHYNQNHTGLYLFEKEALQSNKTYDFTAIRTTDPKTQQLVFIITEATEKSIDIDINTDDLQFFKDNADDVGGNVWKLLEKYYDDWLPHLEVFGRSDLFAVTLLTYLSAVGFYWGNTLTKGWLDSLVIGDTRTGKSKLVKNFIRSISLGAYVSGENSKNTGIIGGLQKLGDNWSLSWGAVPLNDKRLCVIDEASGMRIEDITQLSQMRSEGILSIAKIITETTTARTRLLWITNPRSGNKIDDFSGQGMEAIEEFLPIQEDLARFDIVTTAALEDVKDIHIECGKTLMTEKQLNIWRELILFAWSLNPKDIIITKKVKRYIIDKSKELCRHFMGSSILLDTNSYEKIARMAISCAVLTYSVNDENQLIIKKEHVDGAFDVFKNCYKKESLGFTAMSADTKRKEAMYTENVTKIKNLCKIYPNITNIACRPFQANQLQELLGIDKADAYKILTDLSISGLIQTSKGASYIPDKLLVSTLRNINQEKYRDNLG